MRLSPLPFGRGGSTVPGEASSSPVHQPPSVVPSPVTLLKLGPMRGVLLAAGGLAIIAAGCVACNASRRSAHAPPHLQVPDEILVRLSVPASHRESETALLAGLEHLFGPPRDVCCPSDPRLTYRFGIGDRSVEQAVREARALDPDRVWAQPNFIYTPDKQPNDPEFKLQWSLDDAGDADIDAPEAWDVVIGDPRVAVAIVDSGVWYKNPDLDGRVWKNDVECTGSPGVDDDGNGYIDDCYGIDAPHAVSGGAPGPVPAGDPNAVGNDHGTAVAGIA